MSEQLIVVKQLPIIEEQLHALKAQVDQRVEDALSLVCTEETVAAVKAVRSDLRKDFNALEEQRKAVKKAVLGPYEQFEAVYKECVSDAFSRADAELRGKISDTETEIKKRCEDGLRAYFDELCAAEGIDWLAYERAGIQVSMTSAKQKTPKKLREQLASFVTGVAKDMALVADMDNAEETLVEYKRTLSLADALAIVQDRHRRIEREREERASRAAARAAEEEAVARVRAAAQDVVPPPTVTTVQPPVEQGRIYTCRFTVRATRAQLKRLKDFLIQEGIQYE